MKKRPGCLIPATFSCCTTIAQTTIKPTNNGGIFTGAACFSGLKGNVAGIIGNQRGMAKNTRFAYYLSKKGEDFQSVLKAL